MKFLLSIHILRGIAALLVVFGHSMFRADIGLLPQIQWLGLFAQSGVACFFVISGFVLPYSLHDRYRIKDYPSFLLRRAIRLEPTYIAAIVVAAVMKYFQTRHPAYPGVPWEISWGQIAAHLAYFIPFTKYEWLNPVFWTLAIEFQFYLIIGLLFPLIKRMTVLNVWLATTFVCLLGLPSLFGFDYPTLAHQSPLFALGMVTYLARVKAINLKTHLICSICLSILYSIHNTWDIVASGFITSLLITYWNPKNNSLGFFGSISYSLYVFHTIVLFTVIRGAMLITGNVVWRHVAWLLAILVTVLISYIVYLLVEKPSHKLSKRIKYGTTKSVGESIPRE